jgi:hypothetical protein
LLGDGRYEHGIGRHAGCEERMLAGQTDSVRQLQRPLGTPTRGGVLRARAYL